MLLTAVTKILVHNKVDYVSDYNGQYWPNQSDVIENPYKRGSVQNMKTSDSKGFYSKQLLRDDMKQMSRHGGQGGKEETNIQF